MLLALETSTQFGSLCLVSLENPEKILLEEKWEGGSRGLFPILEKHQKTLKQVSVIAVGLGPGNFSGIRVSLAVAKAWRTSRNTTLIGVPSVNAIGKQFAHITRLGVFGDAKRGDYYFTLFEKGRCIALPKTIPRAEVEQEVEKLTLAVSTDKLPEISERTWSEAKTIAQLAWEKWKQNPEGDKNLEPIYLREPVELFDLNRNNLLKPQNICRIQLIKKNSKQ